MAKHPAGRHKAGKHPYAAMPDFAYWRRGVANAADGALDPVVEVPFTFGPRARVATGGSCFAQHIGRYLDAAGCSYLVTEKAHPIVHPDAARVTNFGIFTARYGNIYTARQLLQLFDRAYGRFKPADDVWIEGPGHFIDPFRPNIQPGGFNSQREYDMDRERHFAAVRKAFETLDIFVFTLGLTEAWRARRDGAVYPVCPGVSGGSFSAREHEFVNFDVEEIVADMTAFLAGLRKINPKAKVILTVSPVPLAATAEKRHVLTSTVYSKSVLRVAAEMIARSAANVAYFPSYEIVASGFAGNYFAPDRRSVTEEGVAHVMRVFAEHFLTDEPGGKVAGFLRRAVPTLVGLAAPDESKAEAVDKAEAIKAAFQVMCDEEALDAADLFHRPDLDTEGD